MKLTEEKGCWNFRLRLSLAEMRLNVLGVCIRQAVRALLDFIKVFYFFSSFVALECRLAHF